MSELSIPASSDKHSITHNDAQRLYETTQKLRTLKYSVISIQQIFLTFRIFHNNHQRSLF